MSNIDQKTLWLSVAAIVVLLLGNNCSNGGFEGPKGPSEVGSRSQPDEGGPPEVPRAADEWALCPKAGFYKSTNFYPKIANGTTDEIGPLNNGTVIVIKMAIPLDAPVKNNQAYGSSIYGGGQAVRTWSVSKTACDFAIENAVVDRVNQKANKEKRLWGQLPSDIRFNYSVGDDEATSSLVRGQTYYLNIRGEYGCDNPVLGHCPIEYIQLP